MLLHRGINNEIRKKLGQGWSKIPAFLHTFDILEGSAVRHDNKSDNTQCMKIDRRRTHG